MRGQITVIIIMVVVMIVIFATLNSLGTRSTTKTGEQAEKRQQLTQANIQPIKEYVTSCLDLATREAVTLIGKQGGYLYASQGGPVPDFNDTDYGNLFMAYDEHRVAYAIFAPEGNVGGFLFGKPPQYPYVTFPEITRNDRTTLYFGGYYGRNRLVPSFAPEPDAAQTQLEIYIANSLLACVDWSKYAAQNLNITAGTSTVNVSLTKKEVVATLHYTLNITELTTGTKGGLDTFRVTYPVRLSYLFDFMNAITDKDVAEANFTLSQARASGVTTQLIPKIYRNDYLVKLWDEESSIAGKPYEFQFMIHNRAPALHLINNSRNAPLVNPFVVCSSRTLEGTDLPATIEITPQNHLRIVNAVPCEDPDVLDVQLNVTEPDEQNVTLFFMIESDIVPTQGPYEMSYDRIQRLERLEQQEGKPQLLINISASDGVVADYQELYFKTHAEAPRA